ncbi:MAG TPA: ABC transporter substrate-binding protein [bacterium]|nr:ABC transporter substrate-binding protein [bacterium]
MTRRELLKIGAGMAAGVAGAPGRPGAAAAAQAPSQVVIAIWGLPVRMLGSNEAVFSYVNLMINDSLTAVDGQGNVSGRLAAQYPASPDGKTYLVTLRNAKFQDGTPVTAQDVKFSYELYLHPKYPTTAPAFLEIAGAQEYKAGKASAVTGITVVNPRVVRFILNRPYPFFYEQIGTAAILPAHALANVDMSRLQEAPFARRPIGAGPYRLAEWRESESITFEAFRDYWAGAPNLPRVVFKLIPEDATVLAELHAGNIDAGRILPEAYAQFQNDPRVTPLRVPGDTFYWFAPNFKLPIFQDVRVRQAMAYAINREEMLRALYRGLGTVCQSPVHPSLWQYDKQLKGYAHDPAKAKQLLAQAGWTPGPDGIVQKGGQPFKAKYAFLAGKDYQDQALLIQQYLRAVGINIDVQAVERGDFFSRYFTPGAPIELVGIAWFNLIFPPQAELEANFMSTGSTSQIIGYSNPKMDQLLQQVVLTRDRTAQKALYNQIQEAVLADAPHILTIRPDVIWGVSKNFVLPSGVNSLRDFFGSLPRWKAR